MSSLELNAFEGKFDIKELISTILEDSIAHSKTETGPFDPKPFIANFEASLERLFTLRKDAQRVIEQKEVSTRVAERDYSRRMTDLNSGFDAVGKSFSNMESRISKVSRTITKIGEQLEAIHLSRQRAQAALDLIDYYFLLAKNDTSKLDELRKEGREGRQQVAIILRRLRLVASEVDIPAAEKARENIDKYCEKFEKDTLRLFDKCYRKLDPKMMHHCAQTLLEFNGGASCVQIYVNQHDFFISRNRLQEGKSVDNDEWWEALPDPDATPPKMEPLLDELYKEIRSTVEEEIHIVQAVFPNPTLVMQVFLQRVFQQSVQQHMELVLNKALSLSRLSYLRALQICHFQTLSLVNDLKSRDSVFVALKSAASHYEPALAGFVPLNVPPSQSLTSMLESAMEELFVTYTEGQRAVDVEITSLGELYSNYLDRFTRFHLAAQKTKTSASNIKTYGLNLYDELTKSVTTKAAELSSNSGSSRTAALAASAFLKVAGKPSNYEKDREEVVLTEEDGVLSLDAAQRMLRWHAEAIGRCVELSPASEVARNAYALSKVLAEALGRTYITVALESASIRLDSNKNEIPDLGTLQTIHEVDLLCHLWQQYFATAILPLAGSSLSVRREMIMNNNQTISKIEGIANNLLQKFSQCVVNLLSEALKGQQRTDFRPRNDVISFESVCTDSCARCCEVLERVRDAARKTMNGKNLETLLGNLGITFHGLLLEHLKRFVISDTGALNLAKDLKAYQDTVLSFNVPSLQERYEFLRQLSTLFLVQPESLPSCISHGYLGRIDFSLLKPYLEKRGDWQQSARVFDQKEFTLRERGAFMTAKLGALMDNFEGLRLGDGLTNGLTSSSFIYR